MRDRLPARIHRALRRREGRPAPGRGPRAAGAPRDGRLAGDRRPTGSRSSHARFERSAFRDSRALARSRRARRDVLDDRARRRSRARGDPSSTSARATRASSPSTATLRAEIEARLPRCRRASSRSRRRSRRASTRSASGRSTDVGQAFDATGFFPGPAAPGRRSAGRARGRPARGRRSRASTSRSTASRSGARRGGAVPPAPRLVLAVPGRRGARPRPHRRVPPRPRARADALRVPGLATSSSAPSRVEEGFGLPVARGPGLRRAGAALRHAGPARDRRGRGRYFRDGDPGEPRRRRCPRCSIREARARARDGGPGGRRRASTRRAWPSGSERAFRAALGGRRRDARASPSSSSTTAAPARRRRASRSLREAFAREKVAGEIVLVDCGSGPEEVRALARSARTRTSFSRTTAATPAA